jgi:hypothetical protein
MDWVFSRSESCKLGKLDVKNKRDAIRADDSLRVFNAIKVGDKIRFHGQRGGQFETGETLYKNIKGNVLYKHRYFVVIDTGKWKTCINWHEFLKPKARVNINDKAWSR